MGQVVGQHGHGGIERVTHHADQFRIWEGGADHRCPDLAERHLVGEQRLAGASQAEGLGLLHESLALSLEVLLRLGRALDAEACQPLVEEVAQSVMRNPGALVSLARLKTPLAHVLQAAATEMMAATLRAFGDNIASSAPLRRIGRPDDMAGVTVFLASRAGSYVTGAVIPVDGGIATTS